MMECLYLNMHFYDLISYKNGFVEISALTPFNSTLGYLLVLDADHSV